MGEKSEKTNLYLVAIVGIVAVVGLVILILGGGQKSILIETEEESLAGQLYASKSLIPPDLIVSVIGIEEFYIDHDAETGQDYLAFSVLFGNAGKGDVLPSMAVVADTITIAYTDPNGKSHIIKNDKYNSVALKAGKTTTLFVEELIDNSVTDALLEGVIGIQQFKITAEIDSNNRVSESNERNNKLSTTLELKAVNII